MCGITGIFADELERASSSTLRMIDAQAHRGLDGEGLEVFDVPDGTLSFGHRRLSILDLSDAGRFPTMHPETGHWIYNSGEIYNFPELRKQFEGGNVKFKSNFDTEVILHA